MYTSYEKIYDRVLPKFRSYEIPLMNEEEVKECLHDYLVPAIARFHVCRKDLSDRDDVAGVFNVALSDMEIEILSNYLLLEYLDSTYIRTPTLLKVNLSSSDFNAFSSANMLDKLMAMHKTYLSENEGLLLRYAWMSFKESGISFSTGYQSKDDSIIRHDECDDAPQVNVGETSAGKPWSEPEVKDSQEGADVTLDFTLPSTPEFRVKEVNTVSPDEKASVEFVKNVDEGTVDAVFNIPQGQKGEGGSGGSADLNPIDNQKIDGIF